MSEKQSKTKKPRVTMTMKPSPPASMKGWRIKATGITLIEPCEEEGIHIECASTIKEVKDVSINMGKDGISMFLPTGNVGATVILSKGVNVGVEMATSATSVNMFI